MQEDDRRDVGGVGEMCEGWSAEVRRGVVVDTEYNDNQTWMRLGPRGSSVVARCVEEEE